MIGTLTALAAALALIAGYLFGTEYERDRRKRKAPTHGTAEPHPTADDPVLSDREWERFVCAIYALADGDTTPEG